MRKLQSPQAAPLIPQAIRLGTGTHHPSIPVNLQVDSGAAIEHLYGINNYELNSLADLSLRAGQFQTAQQTFKKMGSRRLSVKDVFR